MRKLDKELENRKIITERLIEYGFIKKENSYLYNHILSADNFKIIVKVENNQITSRIIDININEDYLLADIPSSNGEFVGKIKKEYEAILKDVIEKCTTVNIFKSNQAIEIINYIKNKYNDDLEHLWNKFPNNAVWRNKQNNKWYGALLTIEERKLGIESTKTIEIIDLRYQKNRIKEIVDNKKIYPGYHMNKDNWITIKLDESVDINKIFNLIDNSYNISLKK